LELPSTGWLRRYRVRAHGAVTQAELDALRGGVTISGIHYGPIEATLDRVQGSNLWLTFAIREGKNREVRNVLGHLGLTVTRLIRVSFGPFQLGELAAGAVEEVGTRTLREQLGNKLATASGADFSAPLTAQPASPQQMAGDKPKRRQSSAHAWRAHEPDRPTKKLHRVFRGSRRGAQMPPRPSGEPRAEILTDRKGRRVAVERYGQPPVREAPRPSAPQRGRHGGRSRRAGDRAHGPRPRHPRDRR